MQDTLRENEFDGIGNFSMVRAIGFIHWTLSADCPYYVVADDNWQSYDDDNKQITTTELYREYLKTLENDR
jgi:hypothetical protein